MSLQTQVLEDDQWVTRTITADELLRESTTARRKTGRQSLSKPPTYGLLTKTVIESPIIRWVLPVQLRSTRYNDVALIGVCSSFFLNFLFNPARVLSFELGRHLS